MADVDDCVNIIKPLAEAELKAWDLQGDYTLSDDDFSVACSGAISQLEIDNIQVENIYFSRLRSYSALSLVFKRKLRTSGDYTSTTSSDYRVTDKKVKVEGLEFSEKRAYGEVEKKTGNYSASKSDVLGALADKYNDKYLELLAKAGEAQPGEMSGFIGMVIE